MYKVSSGTLNLYSSLRDSQTFVTVFVTGHSVQRYSQNCRLVSTANHIQYKYYARDLTMGYARRPAAYRDAPGISSTQVKLCSSIAYNRVEAMQA